jgi:ABC-type polysaccharide transport system permease subunit
MTTTEIMIAEIKPLLWSMIGLYVPMFVLIYHHSDWSIVAGVLWVNWVGFAEGRMRAD